MKHAVATAFAAAILAAPAFAGDCTGFVQGVRPIAQYNHTAGTGFLAVRTGPGGSFPQIGELYAGDEVSVWDRNGNWYYVRCMAGRCTAPLWGDPTPTGWVYGGYLRIGGVCP
ncbi:MAG: SH3 domain-containing protein [Rhodobacter sp.]|nr:SH3 domain-containing protein [Paracoccaceae bacterium]MCC0075025.1 SH3 domain-containing protein [Rhodobacter sp.]